MKEVLRDPIAAHHAAYSEHAVCVCKDTHLRVVSWHPKSADAGRPVVFVAGWVSIVDGWTEFLYALSRRHPVYYLETREKTSAVISKKRLRTDDFRMERFSQDLITTCSKLPIDMEEAIVSGSSLGATVLLEALKHQRLKARGAFLVGPADEFHVPWALTWMPYLFPSSAYHLVRHFVVWYFRHFRVNAEEEPEQMKRYESTILSAHPLRIKLSGRAFMRYRIWPDLETVKVPTRIAYAASDKLHATETIARMADAIEDADLLPCESNRYMHSARLADDLHRFIEALNARPQARGISGDRGTDRPPELVLDLQEPAAP